MGLLVVVNRCYIPAKLFLSSDNKTHERFMETTENSYPLFDSNSIVKIIIITSTQHTHANELRGDILRENGFCVTRVDA
jgi:hypothetical protein